jgi:Zn-dependent protease with chaperone function
VNAHYFDGRSTRVHLVDLSVLANALTVSGEDIHFEIPFSDVMVDEELGGAPRRLRFSDGSFCEVRDLAALRALLASTSHRDGSVDRLQRQLKFVLLACVGFIALIVVGYKVILPWAADHGARHLPPAVGHILSTQTLKALDRGFLLPSKLDAQRRDALTVKFHALQLPEGGSAQSELLFRSSPALGANAFTLPDGTIVMLDQLVNLIGDDDHVMAVLAHESGHAHGHHGLQLLLRSTAVGAFLTLYIGDISHLLAAAPAAIVEAHYSQDLEREADDYGAALLVRNRLSPELMAEVLSKLTRSHPKGSQGGYLASHPPTQERIRHLHAVATAQASAGVATATPK